MNWAIKFKNWQCACIAGAVLVCGHPESVRAAGFELQTQSARGMGQFNAGAAAGLGDGSSAFFNPAGLARLSRPLATTGAHAVRLKAEYADRGSSLNPALGAGPLVGDNGGDAGEISPIPFAYVTGPTGENFTLGLGLNSPFGMSTDYDESWAGRYHALRSELRTIAIGPAIGWRVSNQVALGAGFNATFLDAELSNAIDFGTVGLGLLGPAAATAIGLSPQAADGRVTVTGDDWAFGYTGGILYTATSKLRVGLSYRSGLNADLEGKARFDLPPQAAGLAAQGTFTDTDSSAELRLPGIASIGVLHEPSEHWSWGLQVSRIEWSRLAEIRVEFDSSQPDSVTRLDWQDTWRYSVGAALRPRDRWTFRVGAAIEDTPVPSAALRTPRIPDDDQVWVSAGMEFTPDPEWTLSLTYLRGFFGDADTEALSSEGHMLSGSFDLSVDILGLQMTRTF